MPVDTEWMNEHYRWDETVSPPVLRCKRCDMEVSYLTKHAVVRHGDDIEVHPLDPYRSERDWKY